MQGWWVTDAIEQGGTVFLVSWVVWVILSIVLHELGHGWAAIRCGDDTPIHTGHMTLNPFVHMGTMSLVMFAIVGIAWGAMPVDPTRLRGRHADAIVAAAGPAVNIILAIVSVVLAALVMLYGGFLGDPLQPNLQVFFFLGAGLNIVLAVFNLLPVPPLDGGRILSSFFPAFDRAMMTERGQMVAFFVFLGVFFFGGRAIFPFAFELAFNAIARLVGVLP